MQRHCQLRFGQPCAYSRNHFANHIGGAAAHQLRADEFFRFCVKHQLNKAAVLVFDNGFAVAAHNVFAGNNGAPLRFGFVCHNANRGNFGRSIYARRHKVCVNRRRNPADTFHAGNALRFGCVRQLNAAGNVTDGVNVRHIGFIALAYFYAPAFGFHARSFKVQPFGNGAAPYANQYAVGAYAFGFALALKGAGQAPAFLRNACYHSAGVNRNAAFFQYHGKVLRNFTVHIR